MEEKKCVRCGETIPYGSEYCPTCGAALDGTAYDRSQDFYRDRTGFGRREVDLGKTPMLIMTYGIIAVLIGIVITAESQSVEGIWETVADADGLYFGLTMAQTQTALLFTGVFLLLSGICALVSGFLASKKISYKVCLALCVLACVLPLFMAIGLVNMVIWGIILCLIGSAMAYRIYNCSGAFSS